MFGSGKILVAMITVKGEGSKEMTDHCSLMSWTHKTQTPFIFFLRRNRGGSMGFHARGWARGWSTLKRAHDIAEEEITEIALWVFTVATVPLVYLLL